MSRCLVQNKVIFASQQKAMEAADRIGALRETVLRTYFCGACNGYHLTRKPTMLERLDETATPQPTSTPLSRERRRRQAEMICEERIPRDAPDLRRMLAEVEDLRKKLLIDYKIVESTYDEIPTREALTALRGRRDALRFILKKIPNPSTNPVSDGT